MFWYDKAGLWWPADDAGYEACYRYVMNRITDLDHAVARVRGRRTVVQAGAHVGLWPLRLARSFRRVLSFEVHPSCYEAARRNCSGVVCIDVKPIGLGESYCPAAPLMRRTGSGSWRIDPAGDTSTPIMALDELELKDCDLLVLDIEGYEVAALKGAAETIARCRPVIHVEELPRSRDAIRRHLKGLGYREVRRIHNDAIYTHP